MNDLDGYLVERNWEHVHSQIVPEKPAEYASYDKLDLSLHSRTYLQSLNSQLYTHQVKGVEGFKNGENVCLTTATASGKSLVFQISALETIHEEPDSKILAIYPLKALGNEQEKRFRNIASASGLNFKVGRIDGSVHTSERPNILKNSNVVIMTPDVMHAWLFSNLSSKAVFNFFKKLKLVIVDEAHIYTGVFGSNTAFLLRRLNHVVEKLNVPIQYIAASATMEDAKDHLNTLTGVGFKIIDEKYDGSPQKQKEINLINPPKSKDLLTAASEIINYIANNTDHQFITFVDSRKQAEYIASITARESEQIDEIEREFQQEFDFNQLEEMDVYPYRAGFEEEDRKQIEEQLESGNLKGVISTSALEMGIDIPYLTMGILIGVPRSATSFYQRIGRIGRREPGKIYVVNNNTVFTKNIFRNPTELMDMPYSQSALYMENPRIQYIHSLCLARQGGENDILNSHLNIEEEEFSTAIDFPVKFMSLSNKERIGEISSDLQSMKAQAGEDPHHVFPLRDIDDQYKVEFKQGPNKRRLGTLSHSQLMREAYPGAVYYNLAQAYRVYKVNRRAKLVEVRREKKYTTKPNFIPTLIFPNLTEGNVFEFISFGDFKMIECNLQITESIVGYKERRGPTETEVSYPLNPKDGLYFNQPKFTRNYFTTGVLLNHPILSSKNVSTQILSEIIFEAFLITIPFERQDVGYGEDKHRKQRENFQKGDRFLAIFDQTYGSLRLTSTLIKPPIIRKILEKSISLAQNEEKFLVNSDTLGALDLIVNECQKEPESYKLDNQESSDDKDLITVILPGSSGWHVKKDNEKFHIKGIFYNPKKQKLMYNGILSSEIEAKNIGTNLKHSVAVEDIQEIPGESELGYYNLNTGLIEQI